MSDEQNQVDPETLKLQQAEARAISKHGDRIVVGSAQREPTGKISVEIYTVGLDGERDGLTRRVATSDVHQVHHQPDVKAELDRAKARERRAARPNKNAEVQALRQALIDAGQDPDAVVAAATTNTAEEEAEFDLG